VTADERDELRVLRVLRDEVLLQAEGKEREDDDEVVELALRHADQDALVEAMMVLRRLARKAVGRV
jgi:hypothetical protein